jgi:hypothetical protein
VWCCVRTVQRIRHEGEPQMRKGDALLALSVSAYLFSVPSIGLAANQCITEPKPSGPGEHWYYHVDPVSHQKCWFIGQSSVQVPPAASQSQGISKPKRDAANTIALHLGVEIRQSSQSQPVSKPKRDTAAQTASDIQNNENSIRTEAKDVNWRETLFQQFLQWQEQQKQSKPSSEALDREALFREFVLWSNLHRHTDRADNVSR